MVRKIYRLPHHLLPIAHKYVDQLLSSDVIRLSKSPFSSPLMLVKKPGLKDSNKPIEDQFRVVHDYRKLNSLLIKDSYPMRNLFELIDEVGQGQIFLIIDFTAFGVPGKGHFEYNRSAQGLCNSPASFQRFLDFITTGLPGVFFYLDDVVIVRKTYQQPQGQLRQLLSRFRKYGLKCCSSKLQLAAEEVNYLGYNISKKNGIRPGALKTESIINWRAPTDVTQIRQFLGLCSFFQRTVESFAQTAGPLTKLTRKDSAWKGGPLPEDAQKAFEQLQNKLSSRPCLTPVDFDREFLITVDSISIRVGAILSQFNNKRIEHPCAYASQVLTQAETKCVCKRIFFFGYMLWLQIRTGHLAFWIR
jgi:hypothetical protein